MIDFTGCKVLVNSYEGADFKRKIIYDGDVYMLKFGQKLESDEHKPLQASYTSTPVSEYLGSHIYALAGLPTQHTVMGTYDGRSVVACRDFIESRPDAENVTLVEFKKLENSFLGSSTAGGRTPILGNLLGIFSEHDSLEGIREAAEERYWQMFAVDSLKAVPVLLHDTYHPSMVLGIISMPSYLHCNHHSILVIYKDTKYQYTT